VPSNMPSGAAFNCEPLALTLMILLLLLAPLLPMFLQLGPSPQLSTSSCIPGQLLLMKKTSFFIPICSWRLDLQVLQFVEHIDQFDHAVHEHLKGQATTKTSFLLWPLHRRCPSSPPLGGAGPATPPKQTSGFQRGLIEAQVLPAKSTFQRVLFQEAAEHIRNCRRWVSGRPSKQKTEALDGLIVPYPEWGNMKSSPSLQSEATSFMPSLYLPCAAPSFQQILG